MIVFIPGATGGGPYITKLRIWLHNVFGDKIFIPSSVSTKHGFKPGETIDDRYDRLANEIKINSDDELVLISHSLGVLEIPLLLKKLQMVPKRIILISPPLFKPGWLWGYLKLLFFPAYYEPVTTNGRKNFLKRLVKSLMVHKYIQDEYHGILVKEADHRRMLEKYSEIDFDEKSLPKYYQFLFSNLKNLSSGVVFPNKSEVIQVVLENDPTTVDYPGVSKKDFLKDSGHSSFGYQPDILKGLTDLFNL